MGLLFGENGQNSFRENEPAGFTEISDRQWDALPPNSATRDAFGWRRFEATDEGSIISDATLTGLGYPSVPDGADNVLRVTWPQASGGPPNFGEAPVNYDLDFSPIVGGEVEEVYFAAYVMIDSAWTDSDTNTKFFFFKQFEGDNHYLDLARSVNNDRAFDFRPQGVAGSVYESSYYWNNATDNRGKWVKVEVWFDAQVGATGSGKVWVDGVEVSNHTDLHFHASGDDLEYRNLSIQLTSSGPNAYSQDFDFFMGRTYVSGKAK